MSVYTRWDTPRAFGSAAWFLRELGVVFSPAKGKDRGSQEERVPVGGFEKNTLNNNTAVKHPYLILLLCRFATYISMYKIPYIISRGTPIYIYI